VTVSDTAGMIRVIDASSVDRCVSKCWCQLPWPSQNNKERYRWMPGDPILYPFKEAA